MREQKCKIELTNHKMFYGDGGGEAKFVRRNLKRSYKSMKELPPSE